MDVVWDFSQLLGGHRMLQELPKELLMILRTGSNIQYLETLSRQALNPEYTPLVFVTSEPLFVDICGRWLSAPDIDHLSAVAALARVLPLAPHLSVFIDEFLSQQQHDALKALASRKATALQGIPPKSLQTLLLAVYRLLIFDNERFASTFSPAQLQLLLSHTHRSIRYLAIRVLCLYLHASDAALMVMIKTYAGETEISGDWDNRTIDYIFLSLWEDKRLKELHNMVSHHRDGRSAYYASTQKLSSLRKTITPQDISSTTAMIGRVLVPRLHENRSQPSTVIMTESTSQNMSVLAEAVNTNKSLLVTGPPGAGKTSCIMDVARTLGKSSSMVTLHLNEQTDAKILIGMYTNAKAQGTFIWRPGVLTTAVKEGRWLLIEDLDRAPAEILSTLLPLIERGELLIPNWGESVRATPGFKLIATVRSFVNLRGEKTNPAASMIGFRHWLEVSLQMPSDVEFAEIIGQRYPVVGAYIPQIMGIYSSLKKVNDTASSRSSVNAFPSRSCSPRDLLRCCGRIENLLVNAGVSGHQSIPEATSDHVYLEAVDCFAGALLSGAEKDQAVGIIAQGLQVPSNRVQYCLHVRRPEYNETESFLRVGRIKLPKRKKSKRTRSMIRTSRQYPFAITDHVTRTLESVAAAVNMAEPCLMVGETGTGKTTIIQKLAEAMERLLTVVNLSQQSEAGDLLGGYKPANMRVLAIPMKEEFDELLHLTFPSQQNLRFVDALDKSVIKSRWPRVLALWQEALRMIKSHFNPEVSRNESNDQEPLTKKRKLQSPNYQQLRSRWDKFSSDVQAFQMHLASGSKGFAFSFLEGNIVKAARNGDWVLLDEINLASPDTLESLADLFSNQVDGGPSILLSETGNPERIIAHENFRIFGAMNPATDIGKRDLPASLRSRFTELVVEAPDKDIDNLVSVVRAYLGSHNRVDALAATDIAHLYLEIKHLAGENRVVDSTNQIPHFSLRTLARTLSYATEIAPLYGLRRALFEGFCMSFLTTLNRDSELLLQPRIDKYILGSQKNSKANLHQTPRLPQDKSRNYIQFRHYWVTQGAEPIEEQAHYIITPFIERNLLNLVRATSTRKFPVLLQGPTSSGKTSMIEYLARISGNKFVRINNHEHTDLQEYLGTYVSGPDGRLRYQEGVLVQALREGYWIVLDELNLAPTDVLEALNRLLDDNRELLIPETQMVVRPHENFMLFATQNPPGMYGGRKILSRAFRNRFLELHFDDIPEDELETILRERSQIAPSFCAKIVAVYKKLSILRQSSRLFEQKNSFATLRDLFRWALRDADDREQLAVNGFLLLAERVRNTEERLAVKKTIEEVTKVKIIEDQIYGVENLQNFIGLGLPKPQGIVWTKSMRRLYVLLTQAIKNNEPVLLVGETGSGKTTICQVVAEIFDTPLHIVNAHQNLETGDLIGAQRPLRKRASAEAQLVQDLTEVLKSFRVNQDAYDGSPQALLEAYEALQRQTPYALPDETRLHIEESRTRANALFEWSDGSLVQAMRNGHHFLLDEISLADDSVLERLNSVLEPSRTLLLVEKGSNEVLVSAASGFQFLATMNPGGDYSKRELSPALRNRFTEIWVPNTSDQDELLEIVEAKLLPSRVNLSKPMVGFASWYATVYNAAMPLVSIRDILAWTDFVNAFENTDPCFAALHGAAMVYIDSLGANPAAKTSITEASVAHERQVCLQKLSMLFNSDMIVNYNQEPALIVDSENLRIGSFSLARVSDVNFGPVYSLQAPTTLSNAMKILRALQLRKPILLEGSPGVGKTTLVAALADAIGMPLTRINLSDQTDLMDLFGSDVPIEGAEAGHFGWRDAPFLRAMQSGEWVLLDEMNLASQAVLEGLNACLDHRGQVYVSELNQTFSRHQNFVVFAAQNPHHQGGGRKGLPASFVNRFTVVYADNFSPKDLQVICGEIHPGVPTEMTDKLVQCITALDQLLQMNQRIGGSGGPWEINLRDLLRWLHLLASHDGIGRLAGPSDYHQLLFLQRFRTPEDRAAVTKVLEHYVPRVDHPHDYFHAQNTAAVEIGHGILVKDSLSRPSRISQNKSTNLPIAESVMLCVQNRWPCLLVGPSGSGKSNLIHQLASSVGADIIDLPLNSDMDAMDLVGGYEQLDIQREVAGFLNRLREYTEKAIIEQLSSAVQLNNSLMAIETSLKSASELIELLPLLQIAAEDNPSSAYTEFVTECHTFLHRSTADNQARFEWVDGIIVKALKSGKWLILDNANMCSPSVLDRLNSLLEPDGFLSINEHRDLNGSAQAVKPHTDFRLFLTMDPRHGELSRAMRNRSIELFVPASSSSPAVNVFSSDIESNLSRFEHIQAFDWNSLDDNYFANLLKTCFDHFALSDFHLCRRWQAQALQGLIELSPSKHLLFLSIAKLYDDMLCSEGITIKGIQSVYSQLAEEMESIHEIGALQSIHPFNNPSLLSSRNPYSTKLLFYGHCFDQLVKIYEFGQRLASTADGVKTKASKELSRLERSIVSHTSRLFKNDSTQPLEAFFKDVYRFVLDTLGGEDYQEIKDKQEMLPLANEVLIYLTDLVDLTDSLDFEEAVFQTYHSIGRAIVAGSMDTEFPKPLTVRLAHELDRNLDKFSASWQLYSGLGMERLWLRLKPSTAKSLWQHDVGIQVEELANRFDGLMWASGASLHELSAIRKSLAETHENINPFAMQTTGSLQGVRNALDNLERRTSSARISKSPYFKTQFDALGQYVAFDKIAPLNQLNEQLDILAGKPTRSSMAPATTSSPWHSLSLLQRLTSVGGSLAELAAIRQVVPLSTLHKLKWIGEVPLSSLDLLITETKVLSDTIAKSTATMSRCPFHYAEDLLRNLHTMMQNALGRLFDSDELKNCKAQIDRLPYRLNGIAVDKGVLEKRSQSEISNSLQLHDCLMRVLGPSRPALLGSPGKSRDSIERMASNWIQLFTGSLLLYVPDRPFDPALRPKVECGRLHKRKRQLQHKLQAMRTFEQAFSGQASSFRTQLIEQDLQNLGAEPEVPLIFRPKVSRLGDLQGEFNNILKSIVLRSPDPSTLSRVFDGEASKIQELELLRLNIARVISRFSNDFRQYDDIIKPLIAMLQGLDIGLTLALLASTGPSPEDNAVKFACEATPFLGAKLQNFTKYTYNELAEHNTRKLDLRPLFLEHFAIARSIGPNDDASSVRTMFEIFHSLYQEWKQKLGHDQKENAANSSLYRYRGGEEESEEHEQQDFLQLFPNYQDPAEKIDTLARSTYEPKILAQRLSRLQHRIFQGQDSATHLLLCLLRRTSSEIAGLWQDDLSLFRSQVPVSNMLSALILSLDEKNSSLHNAGGQDQLYNFYTDPNLPEARKLVAQVHKIRVRFLALQDAWPEHATLEDVLRTSSELLSLRHTDPIAKLLTKTEQLHGYVHEWQIVASKEYSVNDLYNQLTNLLVDWRRLELSTWARLFDMEDKHCVDDADSWWFIAYEVIVAAPLSIVKTHEDIHGYAEKLFSTLEGFLATTSMGQYSHRLNMIQSFEIHIQLLAKDHGILHVIHDALSNFLGYYRRFESTIHDTLHTGRQTLEKKMKEILLLASWKDTNIVALRDSAKRSHHQLFKLTRKYRGLLAQSTDIAIGHGLPDNTGNLSSMTASPEARPVVKFDQSGFEMCQRHISTWKARPVRFRQPIATAGSMIQLCKLPATAIDGSTYLESFALDLIANIRILQKETPSRVTKENNEAIKHLKVRKRKLYSETLKSLRKFGLRSNLGADVLKKQGSMSMVLSSSPAFRGISQTALKEADYYFHQILNLLPQIKERSQSPSEDLGHGEVARSIGYLESIISVIMKQRVVLAGSAKVIASLEATCNVMEKVWAPDSYKLQLSKDTDESLVVQTHHVMKWLPSVLDVARVIVQKHEKLGGSAAFGILMGLEHWRHEMMARKQALESLPTLPPNIFSSLHTEVFTSATTFLKDFRVQLSEWKEKIPNLVFVLEQIELWTGVSAIKIDHNMNEAPYSSLSQFDQEMTGVLDSILVAMQRMQEILSSTPSSDDEIDWLLSFDTALSSSLKRLHPQEVTRMLDYAMSKMQYLHDKESNELLPAAAVCSMALPIVQQYRNINELALSRYATLHRSLCRLASILAKSFSKVVSEGFCSPSEDPAPEAGKTEKLEGGTGLGEGEGAEDISKNIEEDEDLSELAQQNDVKEDKEELEDQEDAVDMNHDELEGEMGDVSEEGDEENDKPASETDDNEIDDETGDVDDLDPSAVDEKLWDGKKEETEKEKESSKPRGTTKNNEQAADNADQRDTDAEEGEEKEDETSQDGADEGEEVVPSEIEKMDPRAQEGETLDLPEEMSLDNLEDNVSEIESGDHDMEDMSDADQPENAEEEVDELRDDQNEHCAEEMDNADSELSQEEALDQDHDGPKDIDSAESPVDTEPDDEDQKSDRGLLQDRQKDSNADKQDNSMSEAPGLGEDMDHASDKEPMQKDSAQGNKGAVGNPSSQEDAQAPTADGQSRSDVERPEGGQSNENAIKESVESEAFKMLGNALEEWHRKQRQIQHAPKPNEDLDSNRRDAEMADQEFEHLQDDQATSNAQALGAATDEQARALDEQALDSEMLEDARSFPINDPPKEDASPDEVMEESTPSLEVSENTKEQVTHGAFVANNQAVERIPLSPNGGGFDDVEDINELDNELSTTHLQAPCDTYLRSAEEAHLLWSHCGSLTRELSLSLTEQLRLILAPTLATKMRGDFRTGKRLNIKRIIPYIASQYKRDKIWMRRSIPSKRNYQIMLAVDDSKSMGESGSGQLAFETLALVTKSLSMLEVGEICVVGFGNEVVVAHEFSKPFSGEAGAEIFQRFGFRQTKTNVRKLVAESISLFREARRKTFNAGADLWQLELIISDGVCEDHDTIRRLVRQAQEERIMIVFVIVDALLKEESIMDMSQAVFEPDASGETKLKIKRYLDGFPFPYYLVVGDVRELPAVLSQALRQWFSEVVESP